MNTYEIDWLEDCDECGSTEGLPHIVKTESEVDIFLSYGDEVKCQQCYHEGEIDVEAGQAFVCWSES
tara:strand:- start:151 stop:351 length:201 start_codon:yes stop_codon:yes gene_type:complete